MKVKASVKKDANIVKLLEDEERFLLFAKILNTSNAKDKFL